VIVSIPDLYSRHNENSGPALSSNTGLGCKSLSGANSLAYYKHSLFTKEKKFYNIGPRNKSKYAVYLNLTSIVSHLKPAYGCSTAAASLKLTI